MSNSRNIEITAKTEEEARQIAINELNENETIVSSEVISAPAKGLFGLVGKQEYKIKFTIEEKQEEKSVERGEKLSRKQNENYDDSTEDFEKSEEEFQAPTRNRRREWNGRRERGERGERGPRRERGRRNFRRNREDFREHEDFRERGERENEPEEQITIPERPKEPVTDEIKNNECYSQIFDLIKVVAENVGIENIQLTDYMRDGAWVIEASAEDVSQLIGKRGHTLDSVQYLMNIIFNKGNDESRTKIVLDAQGYREKRYQSLIHLANRMARKAANSRRPIELEPMTTLDRRTIHLALKDRTDVETFSKGTEPMRRVVISSTRKKFNNKPMNAEWQPLAVDDDVEVTEKTEVSSSVPMFMEEDV